MGDPTFWDDPEKAQKTAQDVNSLKEEVDGFHKLSAGVDDLEALQEMAAEENDESLLPEMDELLAKCEVYKDLGERVKMYDQMWVEILGS